MRKLLVLLLIVVVFCSGCSGSQKEKNQEAENQSGVEKDAEPGTVNEKNAEEGNLTDSSNTSAPNIDYGATAEEFLTSTPVNGMVNDLTDSSFMIRAAFASGGPDDNVITDVVYDKETVRIKAAIVKSDGSSFSVSDGQMDDLAEGVTAQVYGKTQEDGTFQAIEIIVVNFDNI